MENCKKNNKRKKKGSWRQKPIEEFKRNIMKGQIIERIRA